VWTSNTAGESISWRSAWEVGPQPADAPPSPEQSVSSPVPDTPIDGTAEAPGSGDEGFGDEGGGYESDEGCAIQVGTGIASPSQTDGRSCGPDPRIVKAAAELLGEWAAKGKAGEALYVPSLLGDARLKLADVGLSAEDAVSILVSQIRDLAEPVRPSLPFALYTIISWLCHLATASSSSKQGDGYSGASHLRLAEALAPAPLAAQASGGAEGPPSGMAALGVRLGWLTPELSQLIEKHMCEGARVACDAELVGLALGCVSAGSTLLLLEGSAPTELARSAHLVLPAALDFHAASLVGGGGEDGATAGLLTGWSVRLADSVSVPLVMLQVSITCSRLHHGAWFLKKAVGSQPFFHPAAAAALGLDAANASLSSSGGGGGARLGVLELDQVLLSAAARGGGGGGVGGLSVLLPSSDRSSEKLSDCHALDVLSHAQPYCDASPAFETLVLGSSVRKLNASSHARLPIELGSADSSQRLAIARAEAGCSYVLRGPPGCGKTQTLANVVCNQAALGKKVLIIAKLKGALGVLVNQVHKLAPQLRVLTANDFVLKTTGALRSVSDAANAIAGDDRLRRLLSARTTGSLWQATDGSDEESAVRTFLNEGWSLAPKQPPSLLAFWQEGVVGAHLTKPKHKPKFVCSLCGKTTASAPPLAKHLNSHAGDAHDEEEERRKEADRSFAQHWLGAAEGADGLDFEGDTGRVGKRDTGGEGRAQDGDEYLCGSLAQLAAEALSRTPSGIAAVAPTLLTPALLSRAYPAASPDELVILSESANEVRGAQGRVFQLSEQLVLVVAQLRSGMRALHAPCLQLVDGASLDLAAGEIAQGAAPLARHFNPSAENDGGGFARLALDLASGCVADPNSTKLQIQLVRMLRALPVATNAAACDIIRSCHAATEVQVATEPTIEPALRRAALQLVDALSEVLEEREELRDLCHAALAALRLQMLRRAVEGTPSLAQLLRTWDASVGELRACEVARRAACSELLSARTKLDEAHAAAANPTAAAALLAAFDATGGRAYQLHSAVIEGRGGNGKGGVGAWRLLSALHPIIALTCDEVARHLPPAVAGGPPFDVVVFDEASQLPTQQSLGCVGRAAQCIIAGDDRQLPPPGGLAGLLDDGLGSGLPLLPLEVHYRSASQSLIAVSNALFYHGSLASFPSAHDFALAIHNRGSSLPTGCSQSSARGLCRRRVGGGMISNYSSEAHDEINNLLATLPQRDPGAGTPRYSGSPQGFINPEQAKVALAELAFYLRSLPAGEPMSVGVITLNRPQRSLIHQMVEACKGALGLEALSDHAWRRSTDKANPLDVTLFIQSIDQIQGEERDLIIFSTLLAPRGVSAAPVAREGVDEDEDEDDQDLDNLEVEQEAAGLTPEQAAESGGAGNDGASEEAIQPHPPARATKGAKVRRAATAGASAAPAGGGAPRFSYSTIAHPHGERLLNVGLTRAVRSMLVLFHPRMMAPEEHHAAPGKRAWGWLVRYLLATPPRCPCENCASLYTALVPPSAPAASAQSSARGSIALPETIAQAVLDSGEANAGAVTRLGGGGGGGARSLVVSVAYGRVEASSEGPRRLGVTALLCDATRDQAVCVRDRFGLLPEVMRQPKAGWARVGLVSSLHLLGRFADVADGDAVGLLAALHDACVAAEEPSVHIAQRLPAGIAAAGARLKSPSGMVPAAGELTQVKREAGYKVPTPQQYPPPVSSSTSPQPTQYESPPPTPQQSPLPVLSNTPEQSPSPASSPLAGEELPPPVSSNSLQQSPPLVSSPLTGEQSPPPVSSETPQQSPLPVSSPLAGFTSPTESEYASPPPIPEFLPPQPKESPPPKPKEPPKAKERKPRMPPESPPPQPQGSPPPLPKEPPEPKEKKTRMPSESPPPQPQGPPPPLPPGSPPPLPSPPAVSPPLPPRSRVNPPGRAAVVVEVGDMAEEAPPAHLPGPTRAKSTRPGDHPGERKDTGYTEGGSPEGAESNTEGGTLGIKGGTRAKPPAPSKARAKAKDYTEGDSPKGAESNTEGGTLGMGRSTKGGTRAKPPATSKAKVKSYAEGGSPEGVESNTEGGTLGIGRGTKRGTRAKPPATSKAKAKAKGYTERGSPEHAEPNTEEGTFGIEKNIKGGTRAKGKANFLRFNSRADKVLYDVELMISSSSSSSSSSSRRSNSSTSTSTSSSSSSSSSSSNSSSSTRTSTSTSSTND